MEKPAAAIVSRAALGDVGWMRRADSVGGPSDKVHRAVGAHTFCLRNATRLSGMAHGTKRELGSCFVAGKEVVWDYWFPHLGVAVDTKRPDETEAEAKIDWATERAVIYCVPQIGKGLDLEQLETAANERRAYLQGH